MLYNRISNSATYNPGQNDVGQAFFGPNPTPPPGFPPCNVVRKERLADESSNIASGGGGGGGEGGSERILQQFGKKALCPTHFGQDCMYSTCLQKDCYLCQANVGETALGRANLSPGTPYHMLEGLPSSKRTLPPVSSSRSNRCTVMCDTDLT